MHLAIRSTSIASLAALIAFVAAARPAQAQLARAPLSTWTPTRLEHRPATLLPDVGEPSPWAMALGGVLGEVGAAGLMLGIGASCGDSDDACGWTAVLLWLPTAALAVPAGVKWAGSRRSYGRLLLGSLGGMVVGWGVAEGIHQAGVTGDGLVGVIAVIHIGATVVMGL